MKDITRLDSDQLTESVANDKALFHLAVANKDNVDGFIKRIRSSLRFNSDQENVLRNDFAEIVEC